MNVSDSVARAIRTYVPLAVGFALTWAASSLHIVVGPHSQAALAAAAVTAVTGGYYALARVVEHKWPGLGKYLLGAAKPVAAPPAPDAAKD